MNGPRLLFLAGLTLVASACGTEATSTEPTGGGDGSTGAMTSAAMTMGTGPATTIGPDTETTTEVGTADGTATEGDFLGPPDMGEGGGMCDVFAQDCPEGDKCMPWAADGGQSWNATTCSPVVRGPGQVGDTCTVEINAVSGLDDCDVGTMCYNVDVETNTGTCFELCGGSADSPTCEEGLCAVYNDGNLPLCLPDCDPLLQDCGVEQLCLASPSANGFVCILDSLPFSVGDHGAPCEYVNACDPGLFCAVQEIVAGCTNPGGCCAEFCDLTIADPDTQCSGMAQGEACQPWYGVEAPPPGYEDVGFCGIP